jgi:hypothetical protein
MDSHYQSRKKKSDKAKEKKERHGGFSSKRIRQVEAAVEKKAMKAITIK